MRALLALLALFLIAPSASAYVALPPGVEPEALLPVPVTTDAGAATVYPTYPLLTEELADLAAQHRDIVRLHSAGQTERGLELWYMEIADFENPDRVPLDSREVFYIDGGTHANEYIGVIFVMHTLRWLLEGYETNETAKWIVENRHTFLLPLVNPEGSMNGAGRVNDNAVNINRNFPVGWGDIEETPVVNNPGPYAASEKETQAVIGLWAKIAPDYVLSIHCCGNLWLYPYGIEGRDPHVDDYQVFERICDEVLFDVRESCGPTWSTIYPASGITSDAGYELTGANSWTIEMKRSDAGEDPLAAYPWPWGPPAYTAAIEELQKESWRAVLHAFTQGHLYGAHPNATVERVAVDAVTLRVTNDGWGNLSSATVQVVDANGIVRTASVPRLEAGASATVTIAGAFGAGEFPVTIAYGKRPLGGTGAIDTILGVATGADGLIGELGRVPAGTDVDMTPIPGAGLLAMLGAAAVAIALRRK